MKDLELIHIANKEELDYLIQRFQNGPTFAEAFVFDTEDLLQEFLTAINADDDLYDESGYYFDIEKRYSHFKKRRRLCLDQHYGVGCRKANDKEQIFECVFRSNGSSFAFAG